MSVGDEQKEDWIETAVRVARALKLNPVRVRWKLEGLRRRWRRQVGQASGKIEQVRYRHQICPSCGALASEGEQVCVRCRVDLPGRTVQIASRLSGSFSWLTATRLLTVLCVLAYGWVGLHGGGGFAALLSPTPETLMRWGANYQHLGPLLPLATTGGAWWRLATYMLLHGAIWHIAFNLLALSIVGPMCERIYGARRTLLIFWLTGVVAGVASLLFTRG